MSNTRDFLIEAVALALQKKADHLPMITKTHKDGTSETHPMDRVVKLQEIEIEALEQKLASAQKELKYALANMENFRRAGEEMEVKLASANKKIQYCESAMNTDESERYEVIKGLSEKLASAEAEIARLKGEADGAES